MSLELEIEKFRKWALIRTLIMLVLGVVSLALAPLTGHYRGFYLSLTLGSIIVVTCAVYIPLIYSRRAKSVKDIAVKVMQCLWIVTSMGIGYMVTAPAPYFEIVPAVAVALFAMGLIMSVFGAITMLTISKRTGVPLAV